MKKAHEVDFTIFGDDMQFVEIQLDSGEGIVAEAGGMMYMDQDIRMEAVFGDGSGKDQGKGLMGMMLGAGKRLLTGESLFVSQFTNTGAGRKSVAFAAPYPGKIIPMDLSDYGNQLLCQKDAFLCAAKGIQLEIAFQKKVGVGLFGGEGFIMQKLIGDGLAFVHAGGTIIQKELQPGDVLKVDTGCLVALTTSVHYDVEFTGDAKNALFGGEGLFLSTLRGPGHVWLQSIPFSRLAKRIMSTAGRVGGGKGEGSVLGNLGIGDLLGGDR